MAEHIRQEMEIAIKERFNGQILLYRPHVDFKEEIQGLRERGMLTEPDSHGVMSIIYRHKIIIGEIRVFPLDEQTTKPT